MMQVLAACFTLLDLQNARCDSSCKHWGYDFGRFESKQCLCIDEREYDRTFEKRIVLPRKKPPKTSRYKEVDREDLGPWLTK